MSRAPDEPKSWADEAEADALLDELRRQIEAVRARLEEHRLQMRAAGLTSERDRVEARG